MQKYVNVIYGRVSAADLKVLIPTNKFLSEQFPRLSGILCATEIIRRFQNEGSL